MSLLLWRHLAHFSALPRKTRYRGKGTYCPLGSVTRSDKLDPLRVSLSFTFTVTREMIPPRHSFLIIADRLRPVLATVSSSPLMVTLFDEQLLNVRTCEADIGIPDRQQWQRSPWYSPNGTVTVTTYMVLSWGHEFRVEPDRIGLSWRPLSPLYLKAHSPWAASSSFTVTLTSSALLLS